jgi:hypothetical protein
MIGIIGSGCATTPEVKDPADPSSGLLIGRITLTCQDFPGSWGVNGVHTGGIEIYLRDISTKEITSVKSRGRDGLFYIVDPADEGYIITEFKLVKKSSRQTTTLPYRFEEVIGFGITPGSVNNLGDLYWYEQAETKESKDYSKKGSSATVHATSAYQCGFNFKEFENWYKTQFPDSQWNDRTWVSTSPYRWDNEKQEWVRMEPE